MCEKGNRLSHVPRLRERGFESRWGRYSISEFSTENRLNERRRACASAPMFQRFGVQSSVVRSVQICFYNLNYRFGHRAVREIGGPAEVRCQHDVVEVSQRGFGRKRFRGEDVESSTAKCSLLEHR